LKKNSRYPLNGRVFGSESQSGRRELEELVFLVTNQTTRFLRRRLSGRSTDYAVVVDKIASVDVVFLTPR
jgi:hypothetical protein